MKIWFKLCLRISSTFHSIWIDIYSSKIKVHPYIIFRLVIYSLWVTFNHWSLEISLRPMFTSLAIYASKNDWSPIMFLFYEVWTVHHRTEYGSLMGMLYVHKSQCQSFWTNLIKMVIRPKTSRTIFVHSLIH